MAEAKKQKPKRATTKKSTSDLSSRISRFQKDFKNRWNRNPSLYTSATVFILIVAFLVVLFVSNRGIFLAGQINGRFVTTPEFYTNLVTNNGQETWDQIVRETLIKQKAAEAGINASEEEVDEELKQIEERFGGKEIFENTLAQNDTNIEEIREQLEIQVLVEKLLVDRIEVTDEEVANYKKENAESVAGQTDEQIKEALKSQKLNEQFADWFEEIRKEANIKTYF